MNCLKPNRARCCTAGTTEGWGGRGQTAPLEQAEEAPEMAQGTLVTEGSSPCHREAKGSQVTVRARLNPDTKQDWLQEVPQLPGTTQ